MSDNNEFDRICFVIMPFNKKKVGDQEVDFDLIYKEIFEPAISQVELPEGKGKLEPKRTDADKFSGSITQDMYEYITYSRMAFADISGFNPNVFYELGVRHATQEAGTVIFRQPGTGIPFDIGTIKIFDYEYMTSAQKEQSRNTIAGIVGETLRRNRLDSPVRIALRAQRQTQAIVSSTTVESPSAPAAKPANLDLLLRDAEEAVRMQDWQTAGIIYGLVLRLDPVNVHVRMRYGLTLKKLNEVFKAFEEFSTITRLEPDYSEAWREKGVCENLIYRQVPEKDGKKPAWLPSGEESLRKATALNPNDFDAWSSWGGIARRMNQVDDSLAKYRRAAEVSDGHPYPLLNAIKLETRLTGRFNKDAYATALVKAEKLRHGQAIADPPTDTPWCYFDLAEIALYQGNREGFDAWLTKGIEAASGWQIETFRDALKLLNQADTGLGSLDDIITRLDTNIAKK